MNDLLRKKLKNLPWSQKPKQTAIRTRCPSANIYNVVPQDSEKNSSSKFPRNDIESMPSSLHGGLSSESAVSTQLTSLPLIPNYSVKTSARKQAINFWLFKARLREDGKYGRSRFSKGLDISIQIKFYKQNSGSVEDSFVLAVVWVRPNINYLVISVEVTSEHQNKVTAAE
ncbi:hypothetical protein RRG08_020609 [Elysia crispata]|uniref:Uncharacterized protein n=1 Tax=Elysia crispata TaxID=231223 RepID=A0AAE1DEZ6_9GAST|nr:hypothetical protein RRG08_020609 [Elysia crispata]